MRLDALLRSVLGKALHDHRRALVWWMLGVLGFVLLTVAFWPTIRDQAEDIQQLIRRMPPAFTAFLGDLAAITTGAGYVQTRLMALMLPLLLIVHAIGRGTDAIAGDEERGTLELLLAEPIARRRIVLERAAAMALASALLGLVAFVSLWVSDVALDMGIGARKLALGSVGVVLLALSLGGIALALGGLTGRKGLAMGVATTIAAAGWLVDGLARLTDKLDYVVPLSPYHHFVAGASLIGDVEPWRLLVLGLVAGGSVMLAAWGFERRDVGV